MDHDLVRGLRANGIDVISAAEAGRLGLPDEEQLSFATSEGRALYTCNVRDFPRLNSQWLRAGMHHAGIIVLPHQLAPLGAQIRALSRLAQSLNPEAIRDRLEFLRTRQE